jgi:hypothetical protein
MKPRSRCLLTLPLLLAAAPLAAQPAPSFPGVITGQVFGPDTKPLPSAQVTAVVVSNVPPRKDSTVTPTVLFARSVRDGTFSISGVPVGDYRICAEIEGKGLLHTCRWGNGPLVSIRSGSPTQSAPAIRFTAGTPLHIRLSDDARVLPAPGVKGEVPWFGIAKTDGIAALPLVSSDAGGRDYEMLVPFGTSLSVSVMNKSYTLTSPGANLAAADATIPALFATGITPAQIVVHVTGKK